MKTHNINSTRREKRLLLKGMAIFFTLLPFAFVFSSAGGQEVHWLLKTQPPVAFIVGVYALGLWGHFLRIERAKYKK